MWVKPLFKSLITTKEALSGFTVFSFSAQTHFQWESYGHFYSTVYTFYSQQSFDQFCLFSHKLWTRIFQNRPGTSRESKHCSSLLTAGELEEWELDSVTSDLLLSSLWALFSPSIITSRNWSVSIDSWLFEALEISNRRPALPSEAASVQSCSALKIAHSQIQDPVCWWVRKAPQIHESSLWVSGANFNLEYYYRNTSFEELRLCLWGLNRLWFVSTDCRLLFGNGLRV